MSTAEAYFSSNNDDNASRRSALDELKNFLDEIASYENRASEIINTDDNYDSTEHQRSILDKLKHLLQLCIDEGGYDLLSGSQMVESLNHEQLKILLDISLIQLALISKDTTDNSDVSEGLLEQDELKSMLDETYIIDAENASISSNSDETDTYLDSSDSENGDSDDATACTDSVIEDLKAQSDNSDKTDNEYLIHDTVMDLLSESDQPDNSVLLPDDPTAVTADIEKSEDMIIEDRENMVAGHVKLELEDHAENIDGAFSSPDIIAENIAEETVTEPVPEKAGIVSDEPEQMVTVLKDSSTETDHESAGVRQLVKDDSGKNPMIFVGMFLFSAVLSAAAMYWGSSGNTDEQTDQLQLKQNNSAEQTVTGNSEALKSETALTLQAESETVFPDPMDEDNDYDVFFISLRTEDNKTEAAINDKSTDAERHGAKDVAIEPSAMEPEVPPSLQAETDNTITENETDQSIDQQSEPVPGSNAQNDAFLAESIPLIIEHMTAVESSNANTIRDIEKTLTLISKQQVNPATTAGSGDDENNQLQDENIKNLELPGKHLSDAESVVSKLQQSEEEYQKPEPVRSVASIVSEMNAAYQSKLASGEITDQTYAIWSVYLSSYYGNPPPAGELDFLDNTDVPYEIKKTSVNGADWYRVLVNNSTEYKAAKDYAEMLKARLGVKKIWISKKKYSYE